MPPANRRALERREINNGVAAAAVFEHSVADDGIELRAEGAFAEEAGAGCGGEGGKGKGRLARGGSREGGDLGCSGGEEGEGGERGGGYRVYFTVFSRFFAPPPLRSSSAAWRLGQTMTLLLLSDGGGLIDS